MSTDAHTGEEPWHDGSTLEELYHGEGMSLSEMSDRLGCTPATIRYHMEKNGIDRRPQCGAEHEERPWDDRDTLDELYNGQGLSCNEIGEKLGCSHTTVLNHMEKLGVERRSPAIEKPPRLKTHKSGYEVFRVNGRKHWTVYHHRLLAVAECGFDAVKDKEVHHKNGIPWDNTPDNLEPMTAEEHTRLHRDQGDFANAGGKKLYSEDELLEWIDSFVKTFGVVPSQGDIVDWPGPSAGPYIDRFGSFPKAIKAAGYTPRSERGGSDE